MRLMIFKISILVIAHKQYILHVIEYYKGICCSNAMTNLICRFSLRSLSAMYSTNCLMNRLHFFKHCIHMHSIVRIKCVWYAWVNYLCQMPFFKEKYSYKITAFVSCNDHKVDWKQIQPPEIRKCYSNGMLSMYESQIVNQSQEKRIL